MFKKKCTKYCKTWLKLLENTVKEKKKRNNRIVNEIKKKIKYCAGWIKAVLEIMHLYFLQVFCSCWLFLPSHICLQTSQSHWLYEVSQTFPSGSKKLLNLLHPALDSYSWHVREKGAISSKKS